MILIKLIQPPPSPAKNHFSGYSRPFDLKTSARIKNTISLLISVSNRLDLVGLLTQFDSLREIEWRQNLPFPTLVKI